MEFLLFPKNSYYLTQGFGLDSYSHKGTHAIDVSSAGGGYKEVYAPFSGYVAMKFVDNVNAYTIWLVSNEKVLCANNKTYYVVMQLTHPSEIAKYNVNDTFKQGDFLMNDGDTGNATGKHLDIEIAVYENKEDIKFGFYRTEYGTYSLINSVDPIKYLVLKNDCLVLNDIYQGKRYYIKKEREVIGLDYDTGKYKTLDNVRVRKGPGINYEQKKVKDLTKSGQENATSSNPESLAFYRVGTVFDALEIIIRNGEVWAKTYSGYVNVVYKNEVNCQRVD